ncbi:hypothetical protein ACP70R_041119 [Stipagrostis hirtigluma subsp. patula]
MSRFLRAAALDSAKALGNPYSPRPFSGVLLASSLPSAAGHLGLVRARPGLRDLNALLNPEAFLLDATHALGAVALRHQPFSGGVIRQLRGFTPQLHAQAEAAGDYETAHASRLFMAMADAEEGRFDDCLGTLALLVGANPGNPFPRICAAAVYDLLTRVDDSDRWLAGVPEALVPRPRDHNCFHHALVAATLGGAPGAVAGSRGQVASAALLFIVEKLWGSSFDGEISVFKKVLITALLNRAVKTRLDDDIALPSVMKLLRDGSEPREPAVFHTAPGTEAYVLSASQALLSSVFLREPPLYGERVREAMRVAERDLGRAIAEKDTAAAADLRLVLALLAARDGLFQEALDRYNEAARDDPSDARPRWLAEVLCAFASRKEESDRLDAIHERLAGRSPDDGDVALMALTEELVVAVSLGGVPYPFKEGCRSAMRVVVGAAGSRVDAALVSALRDKKMSIVERLELRATRAFLYAGMSSALQVKECKGKDGGSATATK